jgi:hypothetical protein
MAKIDAWHHGVSPSARQRRLESLTTALRRLADAGLGAASIIANFHHRRVVPLMERELCIFGMSNAANPVSLARSQLLQECLFKEYATTRARCVIRLKSVPHNDDNLGSAGECGLSFPCRFLHCVSACPDSICPQLVTVSAARSDPPTPRARAADRATQQWEQEQAARAKEKRIRRWEHMEQYNEEYQLHE